jgi:hypothetical protein
MTNCSDRQKKTWRQRLKRELRGEFKCIDPTDATAAKGSLAVSTDIEKADVVIANMWKESIGTTLGIIQARRFGIPVILIDQHYLDSPILSSIVGEYIVHSEESAVNKLRNEVAPELNRDLSVAKRNGAIVPFDIKKLQRSMKAASVGAGVDDPIFHILLSRRVHRAIATAYDGKPIATLAIRDRVFLELRNISSDSLGEGDAQQVEHANALLTAWEYQELQKTECRSEKQRELEYLTEIEELSGKLGELELETENLRARLASLPSTSTIPKPVPGLTQNSVTELVRRHLKGRRVLCIERIGTTSFASAFERRGLSRDDFAELFEELMLDGKQSNLNLDLKTRLRSHVYILYAFDGLRHLADGVRSAPNLFAGAGANDAVRKFLASIRGKNGDS